MTVVLLYNKPGVWWNEPYLETNDNAQKHLPQPLHINEGRFCLHLPFSRGEVNKPRRRFFSDRVYAYFQTEAQDVLNRRQIETVPFDSSFLSKESEAEKENVIVYIQQLKGIKVQEPMHGIGIISLATQPRKLRYDESRKLYVLSKAAIFAVTVEVINQGNITETNIPAVAVLKTRNNKEQRREQYILSIKQNERKPVTFQNFLPSTRGANILTITIGPLPGEQYTKNNSREFKFVME